MKIFSTYAFMIAGLFGPLGVASAQLTSVGPFTGGNSEDFESITPSWQTACHSTRILGGTAQLCASNGGNLIVAGASHCSCILQPQGQIQAMAAHPGYASLWFAVPAVRFGGYFALNCGTPDGTAVFWDTNGMLIGSMPLNVPADCSYHWQGFAAPSGVRIGLVELKSNLSNGQLLHLDGLEVDCVASVETYCSAKMNSLNCFPRIEVEGVPTAGAPDGWNVRAVNVRPGGVPGTLMYAVGGARAALPFQCGTLCIGPSGVRRSVAVPSTPVGQLCEGVYRLDMNRFAVGALGGNPSAALSIPGTTVRCQWWGRDQGFAPPCNTTLSNAVEYVIQ